MQNKEIEEAKKEMNIITTTIKEILQKDVKITDEEVYTLDGRQYLAIENLLQYIKQLENKAKELEFQDNANKTVHDYDVNMIDKVKGENVEQYKKIMELENKVKELEEVTQERDMYRKQLNDAFSNGFIHKSKIEDKIEELKNHLKIAEANIYDFNVTNYWQRQRLKFTCQIWALQELLEEK